MSLSLYVVFCIGFEVGIIIVPDAADIVCGAKNFMWGNFGPHFDIGFVAVHALLCGAKMNSTFMSVERN